MPLCFLFSPLFGSRLVSDRYWNTVIRRNVKINFADALTQEEARDDFYLKSTLTYFSHPESDGKYLLFTCVRASRLIASH